MKSSPNLIVSALFFLTAIVHFLIWTYVCDLDPVTIIKFYLFLSVMFIMMVTLIIIVNRTVPDFLALSLIGLIMLKFVMMYLIRNKLNFQAVPDYKFHFAIPYFILTSLLTYYAIRLINPDIKMSK